MGLEFANLGGAVAALKMRNHAGRIHFRVAGLREEVADAENSANTVVQDLLARF